MNPLPALFLEAFGGDLPPECYLSMGIEVDQDAYSAELSTVRRVGQWQVLVERIRPEHPSHGHLREWDERVFDVLAEARALHWWTHHRAGVPHWNVSPGPDFYVPGEGRWIEVKTVGNSLGQRAWLHGVVPGGGMRGAFPVRNDPAILMKIQSQVDRAVRQKPRCENPGPLTVILLVDFDSNARTPDRWKPIHYRVANLAEMHRIEIVVADSAMGSACAFGA